MHHQVCLHAYFYGTHTKTPQFLKKNIKERSIQQEVSVPYVPLEISTACICDKLSMIIPNTYPLHCVITSMKILRHLTFILSQISLAFFPDSKPYTRLFLTSLGKVGEDKSSEMLSFLLEFWVFSLSFEFFSWVLGKLLCSFQKILKFWQYHCKFF